MVSTPGYADPEHWANQFFIGTQFTQPPPATQFTQSPLATQFTQQDYGTSYRYTCLPVSVDRCSGTAFQTTGKRDHCRSFTHTLWTMHRLQHIGRREVVVGVEVRVHIRGCGGLVPHC